MIELSDLIILLELLTSFDSLELKRRRLLGNKSGCGVHESIYLFLLFIELIISNRLWADLNSREEIQYKSITVVLTSLIDAWIIIKFADASKLSFQYIFPPNFGQLDNRRLYTERTGMATL